MIRQAWELAVATAELTFYFTVALGAVAVTVGGILLAGWLLAAGLGRAYDWVYWRVPTKDDTAS